MCSCSKEAMSSGDDNAISLVPVMDKEDVLTRGASLYQDENSLRSDLFHTRAYLSGTTDTYFSSHVKYSTENVDDASKHQWLFYTPAADGNTASYDNYYWPLTNSLDFFAYAPVGNGYVEPNYSTNPPKFTATMPLTNTDTAVHQDAMKEFMFAYVPNKDKTSGPVPIAFQHPFAAIRFKVSQSHRDLTVKTITVSNIAYKGTHSLEKKTDGTYTPQWTSMTSGNMVLSINKIIPGEVNFGGELGGPYLVLPQDNSTAEANKKTVQVKFHWIGNQDSNWTAVEGETATYTITGKISNDWQAGKVYTYTIDLGNSREEILFKVSVEDWAFVYNHTFDIE